MKGLIEDMKTGKYLSMYLLCGEESYLKRQYKQRLKKAMIPEENSMNYHYYEGSTIDIDDLTEIVRTMPFFSDFRLVIIENSGFFKKPKEEIIQSIANLPEFTRVIFVEDEIDKRGKLYKLVVANGRVVELSVQSEQDLIRWITARLKTEGYTMDGRATHHFMNTMGTDMEILNNELEKLMCYTMDTKTIRCQDIDEICVPQIEGKVFDMIRAVADKEQKKALDFYYELLELKEPPMRILFQLNRHMRLLYEVKSAEGTRYSEREISEKIGLKPYRSFVIQQYMRQSRKFRLEELRAMYEDIAKTEEDIKIGRLTDKLGVELYIVKYSMA